MSNLYFKTISNESQNTWVRYDSITKQFLEFSTFLSFHHCRQQKVWYCTNNNKYLEFTKNLISVSKEHFINAHNQFINSLKKDL